jgi:hypothetical protein
VSYFVSWYVVIDRNQNYFSVTQVNDISTFKNQINFHKCLCDTPCHTKTNPPPPQSDCLHTPPLKTPLTTIFLHPPRLSGTSFFLGVCRKPAKIPHRVVRVGLPTVEKVDTWVTLNNMLAEDKTLVEDAARILRAAPQWLQRCGIHVNMDPVLGRCSWEEERSISIRFRQTPRKKLLQAKSHVRVIR